jgi:hypothetical protein
MGESRIKAEDPLRATCDDIRSKILMNRRAQKTELVQFDGYAIELREPTKGERKQIFKAAHLMVSDQQAASVALALAQQSAMWLAFVPGSNGRMRVFSVHDEEAIDGLLANDDFDELSAKAVKLLNVSIEDIEKNSETTSTGSLPSESASS